MAANAKETLSMLSPETVKKALEAIKNGDSDAAMALLEEMIAGAAGGEEPSSEAKPDAAAGETAPAKPEEEKPEEVAAASATLMRLTGAKSFVEAVSKVDTFRESHLKLEAETQKLAAERATFESAERRKGCADMVIAGVRKPAEVWADDKANAPKAYLAAMPIGDFRAYVKDAIGTRPANAAPIAPPPTGTAPTGVDALSAREKAMCIEMKIDPKDYAARKAATTKKAG